MNDDFVVPAELDGQVFALQLQTAFRFGYTMGVNDFDFSNERTCP
jgi:hypothetical protein